MTSSWVAGTDVIRYVTVPGYDHDWAMLSCSIATETVHVVPLIPHMDGVTQSILLLLVDHRKYTLDLVEVVYTGESIHTLTGDDIIARVSAYLQHVRENVPLFERPVNTFESLKNRAYFLRWGSHASTEETGEPEGESQRHSLDDEVEPNSVTWALDDATVSAIAALLIEAHLPEDQGDD